MRRVKAVRTRSNRTPPPVAATHTTLHGSSNPLELVAFDSFPGESFMTKYPMP